MEQKKPNDHVKVVVTFLCIVSAVAFTGIVYSYQLDVLQNQLLDAQAPKLVNVSLGYTDNGHGVLHISGYVYNPGTRAASENEIQVILYYGNGTRNTTWIPLANDEASDTIEAGKSFFVDKNVTYEGNSPTNVTLILGRY
jgi:hypothetical protein